jgi:hypothetical protein
MLQSSSWLTKSEIYKHIVSSPASGSSNIFVGLRCMHSVLIYHGIFSFTYGSSSYALEHRPHGKRSLYQGNRYFAVAYSASLCFHVYTAMKQRLIEYDSITLPSYVVWIIPYHTELIAELHTVIVYFLCVRFGIVKWGKYRVSAKWRYHLTIAVGLYGGKTAIICGEKGFTLKLKLV